MLDQSFNLPDSNVLDAIFQLPTLVEESGLGRSDSITPVFRKSLQGMDSGFLSNSVEEYQLELENPWQSSQSLSSWTNGGDFLTGQTSSVDLAGNTLATARAITVGSTTTTYTDWVGSTDTNDYYRFSLANSGNFNLGLTGLTADGDVQLLNSSGSVIASSTNGGTASESITRQLSAGTYYIRVYPYQSANTNYNLAVSATSIDLAGNTLATARAITVGSSTTSYTDWVGSTDTNDYYSFSLANSSNFNLSLTGMTADGDVQLLNSGGSLIASSANGGTASESITSQLSAGTYYIRVYPYQSANTNYNLAVSATSGGGGTGFNSTYGYGLVNAAAAVAQAISQPTFADVPNLGGNNWGNDMVNAPEAWARGYTGQGVTVAVIDSGVDISHQDLSNNIWGNTGEIASNGIDDDGNGYTDDVYGWNFGIGQNNNNVLPGTSSSGQGHGTHVAGTIAAANNGIGMTGVAYNSRIMAIRMGDVDSQGRFTNGGNLAQAIRYAVDNGARVINMSLGWTDSTALSDALAYAASRNVITVSAAGNSSLSSPGTPAYYATQYGLSVGAVDSSRTIASFSNRAGTNSSMQHVMAPGVNVYSTLPGNQYASYSGTSMAAPHVAGVVALMLGANPNLTHAQVRSILTSSAVRLP
ncbi:S8 family serine peptidase [Microcystis aeruginosa]|uniref:S8 family serine peptidase n=3 Tax=Microcystis aeruginosa TaxID=1126 RepID=UPI00232D9B25|nr:S8 family serine peptidase [Microcystis aeruginosa]MDB9394621.1 S8 family serine peptidase [Microcystis aeruginosa CS-573]